MTTPEVEQKRGDGFRGRDALINSYRLKDTLDALYDGLFSPDDRSRYHSLVDAVLAYDTFMVAADFESYWRRQRDVDIMWGDQKAWASARTKNIASMGWFSSDRTIREYADEIWHAPTM
jgi:starch phosphorylase